MHTYKIENFERDRPRCPFPWWRQLSDCECNAIHGELAARLLLPESIDGLSLLRALQLRHKLIADVDALSPEFDLGKTAAAFGVAFGETVLLNWYRFDEIDEMRASDVSALFDDIWYPSSDDLDIFDRSLRWILSVAHYGAVSFVTF